MKLSSGPLKSIKLKKWLDPSDFRLFFLVTFSVLLYWLLYLPISYFLAISVPLIGLMFVLAIHILLILGSLLLIVRIRHRFLQLSSILSQDERVSISEISEKFLIPQAKIRRAIMELKKEGIVPGIIDADKDVYLNFDRWGEVRDLLIKHKKLSSEDLKKHFDVSKSEAKFIFSEIQNTKMIPGYFIENNREFITRAWIYDVFRQLLEKHGRINLNKTKQRLGLTDETFWYEFENFISSENIIGSYLGKNEFIKFEDHDQDAFLAEIKNIGRISLKTLSSTFGLVSEEYCKYLITKHLSEGLLDGIFSEEGTSFITLDRLREHVISAIRRDWSLTLLAKRLGISQEVLYMTILRNFNFENLAELAGLTRDTLENKLNRLLVEKDE